MTLIEKTAYPHFTQSLFSNDMQGYFFPNQEEMDFVSTCCFNWVFITNN